MNEGVTFVGADPFKNARAVSLSPYDAVVFQEFYASGARRDKGFDVAGKWLLAHACGHERGHVPDAPA